MNFYKTLKNSTHKFEQQSTKKMEKSTAIAFPVFVENLSFTSLESKTVMSFTM